MKASLIVLLISYCCFNCVVWCAPTENKNDFDVGKLLPKSLLEGIEHQAQLHRDGRILNGLQYVQHSLDAHSVYIPPIIGNNGNNGFNSQQFGIQEQPILNLQVPTSADADKILLRLPTQQLPQQPYSYGVPPPRRHYRITLVRSRKPANPSPQLQQPEVEEKTLIYVLVKKPDESATAAQIEELQKSEQNNIKHHAPEVYFIKYKERSNNALNITPQYLPSTNGQSLQSEDVTG